MIKTSKPTNKSPKTSRVRDFYNSVGNKPKLPLPEEFFTELIKDMKDHVSKEDVIFLRPFFRNQGVSNDSIGDWIRKYPAFATAYEDCMEIIAERRENAALGWGHKGQPQLHPAVHMKTAHLYDTRLQKRWKEEQTFLTDEKIRAAQKAGVGVNITPELIREFSNPDKITNNE